MRALLDVNVLIALLDDGVVDRLQLLGPRQLTDVYLLTLAVAHGARLVTRYKSVSLVAVLGVGEAHLAVI